MTEMDIDSRDVLAAVAAECMTAEDGRAHAAHVAFLVGAEFTVDIATDLRRLVHRGFIESAKSAAAVDPFDAPDIVRMTQAGWFEVWRH